MKYIFLITILTVSLYACSFPDFGVETTTLFKETVQMDDFMYQVEGNFLTTFDISNPNEIRIVDEKELTSNIESLVMFGGVLFIGTIERMTSFKINENGIPFEETTVALDLFSSDQESCDPILVEGNYAYMSLPNHFVDAFYCHRSDSLNQVRVYDISDLTAPIPVDTVQLENPGKMASDANLLFVSDGMNGFRVFDNSDPTQLIPTFHFQGFETNNVIVNNGMLIAVGPDELRQYDYSTIQDIIEVSKIVL